MLFIKIIFTVAEIDSAQPWQIGFQDPAPPVIEGIIDFHHDIILVVVSMTILVGWLLYRALALFNENSNPVSQPIVHGTLIEIVWTITPALILIAVAVPSFALLYSIDEVIDPAITIKAVGHQWYWSYEYSDYTSENGESINFDSYMIPEDDLESGQLRLLEVDNRVVVPIRTHIRLIVTAADVIHCFGLPAFGLKLDACPGRLNQTSMFVKRTGVFYGQCSEICGVNHGFIPIVVEAVSIEDYVSWISTKLEEADEE
jgi:cytochrome c oxidase subunit 2